MMYRLWSNIIGSVILMEPFVVRDGRPKSGVGRRGFLNKQILRFLNPTLGFLLVLTSVSLRAPLASLSHSFSGAKLAEGNAVFPASQQEGDF